MKCPKWIQDHEILYDFVIWIHIWIHDHEEHFEIMSELIYELILKYSWINFKFISVRENVLLIQSNHHCFFAVSSLEALRLLCGCWSVTNRLHYCCNCRLRRQVLWTAEQGGCGGPCKHIMDVTGIKSAGHVSKKTSSWETIIGMNLKDIIQMEQLGLWKAFKQEGRW